MGRTRAVGLWLRAGEGAPTVPPTPPRCRSDGAANDDSDSL